MANLYHPGRGGQEKARSIFCRWIWLVEVLPSPDLVVVEKVKGVGEVEVPRRKRKERVFVENGVCKCREMQFRTQDLVDHLSIYSISFNYGMLGCGIIPLSHEGCRLKGQVHY
jgi:hypothetical protein